MNIPNSPPVSVKTIENLIKQVDFLLARYAHIAINETEELKNWIEDILNDPERFEQARLTVLLDLCSGLYNSDNGSYTPNYNRLEEAIFVNDETLTKNKLE
jgi:hypothetical protein